MKNIIYILIISFLSSSFIFKNEQIIGDSSNYHVMALSGLKMRDLPNLKGKKILTIPYNGEVELIDTGENYGELTIQELKDFYIKGEWVKVRYDGKEGFVFNGYLTQFPLPDIYISDDEDDSSSELEYYLDKKFTPLGDNFDFSKYENSCDDCFCGYSKEYNNHIFYTWSSCNEISLNYYTEIENITLEEAYFIVKALDINNVREQKSEDEMIYEYSKESRTITIDPDGAGCGATINQRKQNSIEIDVWCGC